VSESERRPALTRSITAARVNALPIEPMLNFVSTRLGTERPRSAMPQAFWKKTFPPRASRTTPEKASLPDSSPVAASTIRASSSSFAAGFTAGASGSSSPAPCSTRSPSTPRRGLSSSSRAIWKVSPFFRDRATAPAEPGRGGSTRMTSNGPFCLMNPWMFFKRCSRGSSRRASGGTFCSMKARVAFSSCWSAAAKKAARRRPSGVSGKGEGAGAASAPNARARAQADSAGTFFIAEISSCPGDVGVGRRLRRAHPLAR
jgi:hypothetical protein